MKIYFDNVDISGRTTSGPHSFAHRLAKQLFLLGVEVTSDPSEYDVALVTIEHTNRLNASRPTVQRIDGIWFAPNEFETRNVRIRECYGFADHVVFQSEFDKNMVTKWFGRPRDSVVITNGIEIKRVDRFIDTIVSIRESHEKVFVCSANWHPQKRLRDNVRLYRSLRKSYPSSCLIVMGGNFEMDRDCVRDEIFYTGPISQEYCLQVYAASDWMIHLAWLDHCPNVVCESLSQETPVICGDSGGTKEVLGRSGKNGIVLKDVPYNFELAYYDNPPQFPIPNELELPKTIVDASHLSIVECTKKYIDVFEKVKK